MIFRNHSLPPQPVRQSPSPNVHRNFCLRTLSALNLSFQLSLSIGSRNCSIWSAISFWKWYFSTKMLLSESVSTICTFVSPNISLILFGSASCKRNSSPVCPVILNIFSRCSLSLSSSFFLDDVQNRKSPVNNSNTTHAAEKTSIFSLYLHPRITSGALYYLVYTIGFLVLSFNKQQFPMSKSLTRNISGQKGINCDFEKYEIKVGNKS